MSCSGNNATPPSPAIAPGAESIDPRRFAAELGSRAGGPIDPRIPALVPGFDAPFFQAGLAGYSEAPMRIIARRHGCPYCVTEALLDRPLIAGGRGFTKADLGELRDNVPGGDEDHPLGGQIMGSIPEEMAAAAIKMIEQGARHDRDYRRLAYNGKLSPGDTTHLRLPGGEQLGRGAFDDDRLTAESPQLTSEHTAWAPSYLSFSVIDVNLACPVKKVSRRARGGHWLCEPDGAIELLHAVRRALPSHIPVTVKMRRSFDDTPEMVDAFWRIFDAADDMGCAWVTVHARTVEQKYVGPSRWDLLRDIVRARPERLVFGSGDVWAAPDIFRMLAYTGVAGVSVARGCIGNPWIFRQARQMLAGDAPTPPTIAEQRAVLEDQFAIALRCNRTRRDPELHTGKAMRKFGIRFSQFHPDAEHVRRAMIGVTGLDDWRAVLDTHYTTHAVRSLE